MRFLTLRRLLSLVPLFAGLCVTTAPGAEIIWMNNHESGTDFPAPGMPINDQMMVDLLIDAGHNVARRNDLMDLDAGKLADLEAAELVIVSRDNNSGDHDDGTEISDWNGITTPMILMSTHLTRNSRWLWLDTTSLTPDLGAHSTMHLEQPAHEVFTGLSLNPGEELEFLDEAEPGSTFAQISDVGNGQLLATRSDDGSVWIATWDAGAEFFSGAGQFAGGPRMFLTGMSGGPLDADAPVGTNNLTQEGELVFLNAVEFMATGTVGESVTGDVNGDMIVDLFDFDIIRDNFLVGILREEGNLNRRGVVDLEDFRIWRNAFDLAAAQTVPEPGTLAMGVFAGFLLLSFRGPMCRDGRSQ